MGNGCNLCIVVFFISVTGSFSVSIKYMDYYCFEVSYHVLGSQFLPQRKCGGKGVKTNVMDLIHPVIHYYLKQLY